MSQDIQALSISDIIQYVRSNTLTPLELSECYVKLGAEYAWMCDRLGEIQVEKARAWLALREDCTSDTQAERKWMVTESGINEIGWTKTMKGIEKLLPALRKRIEVMKESAHNQY